MKTTVNNMGTRTKLMLMDLKGGWLLPKIILIWEKLFFILKKQA